MSEHTLPDDCSRWPENPYELLGVPPHVNDRELRRAYARLIRTYKPEQFPEHFRRIREAYESARRYVQFMAAYQERSEEPPDSDESQSTERHDTAASEVPTQSAPVDEIPHTLHMPRSLDDELDEAWDRAIAGDERGAYARLLDLQVRFPDRVEPNIRLYSLLSAAPELDPQRAPSEFLVQVLRRSGGGGICHELYRREVEDNPAEALTDRFADLLSATTQPGLLATLVQVRWNAAGCLERYEVIGNDLPGLRARLVNEDEEIWVRLLLFAADQLAWDVTPSPLFGFADCVREIAGHEHLHLRCADVFDRVEYLERVAVGWHSLWKAGNVPAVLLELLAQFWTRPFAALRSDVVSLLAAISNESDAWLVHLDRVNDVSPELLSVFGRVLDSYQWTLNAEEDDREMSDLLELARHFLEEYSGLRPRLLAFCLREQIHPDLIAQLGISQTVKVSESRLNNIVNDWPLRHVYRACLLFRN